MMKKLGKNRHAISVNSRKTQVSAPSQRNSTAVPPNSGKRMILVATEWRQAEKEGEISLMQANAFLRNFSFPHRVPESS